MKVEGGRRKTDGNVLACFPLKQEAAAFRKIAPNKPGTVILLTGIGRRNAEKSLRNFLAGGAGVPASHFPRTSSDESRLAGKPGPPELVLTCGFAGGLNPDLKLGDVVFEISRSRGDETQINSGKQSATPHVVSYEKLIAAGAKPATFFCADRVATTAAEKKRLREVTGADAVEMESTAIYAVCREHGIPCATVRVISDTAGEDLPLDFNQLSKPDQSLDYGKLFLAIAKSPGKVGALIKLQKQTRFAAERLAEVLGKILSLPK